jgi:tetratricopeptide (TPR) repeat protein
MGALRSLGRGLMIGVALLWLLAGGVALGLAYAPDHAAAGIGRRVVIQAATVASAVEALGLDEEFPMSVDAFLHGAIARYGLGPAGLLLLIAALLPGRRGDGEEEKTGAPRDERPKADPRALRKARRQAASLSRKGSAADAAEYAFASGLLEEAAGYFIEAEEYVRAAEIRHDQNRFIECAELYLKGHKFDSAGRIFSQQGEHKRAAEAYLEAGNKTVAAEMFEKAGDFRRAGDCYAQTDFARHAAKAYVKCNEWKKAAECLDQVIIEESTGAAASDPARQAETRKLVRMAGDLYVRAGLQAKAQAIFERGGLWAPAAELALQLGKQEQAAALFQKGGNAQQAAQVLKDLGKGADASRLLAEHHRDKGNDEEAARHFLEAGDYLAAGDLYRLMEQFEKAGECFEKLGEFAQAAEMFTSAGDRQRAAQNYERGGRFAEAAENFAQSGEKGREAELLARAGQKLRAGELHLASGLEEEAIKVLQELTPEHADFAKAAAILGEIFRKHGKLSLAIKKLTHAIGSNPVSRDNLQAYYSLASVYEANQQIQEAAELYEKILAFDYHHADVSQRLEGAREKLKKLAAEQKAAAQSSAQLSASQKQGRYKILSKLGRGGMGVVYKAQDTVLDRTVAFKVLPETLKENPQALKNFLREAKSAAQLNHTNIVTVYDAGEQDGAYYIAMEYVDGHTLKEIIKHRGRISPGGIVHVLAQMCEALAYAHENKIVHRDVKTANAMWTKDKKAKIMDFGLAKAVEELRNHTTVVSGTPYYMSPEQTLGKNVDHRTDIYSLGVSVFEMATGTLPFREGNLPYHHVHTPPPDPREFTPDLPQVLCAIIARCLEKDPGNRYGSTREILAELGASQNP